MNFHGWSLNDLYWADEEDDEDVTLVTTANRL